MEHEHPPCVRSERAEGIEGIPRARFHGNGGDGVAAPGLRCQHGGGDDGCRAGLRPRQLERLRSDGDDDVRVADRERAVCDVGDARLRIHLLEPRRDLRVLGDLALREHHHFPPRGPGGKHRKRESRSVHGSAI